jgi:hypothetical protein
MRLCDEIKKLCVAPTCGKVRRMCKTGGKKIGVIRITSGQYRQKSLTLENNIHAKLSIFQQFTVFTPISP